MSTKNHAAAAQLTVDCGAIAINYRRLRDAVGPRCQVAGIVKADAYGLGLAPVVSVLERESCPYYFVATLDEGIALRRLTQKPVAVLNGAMGAAARGDARRHKLTPVLNSLAALDDWTVDGAAAPPGILHFDTGMNRLGLGPDETEILLADPQRRGRLPLHFIMSHFACADEDSPLNAQQTARFAAIRRHFQGVPASLANSAGIFLGPETHYQLARPGMALYGLNPTPGQPNPMRPVVALDAPILQVRQARKGESIGYGASHVLAQDARLATVGLGYADGFLRALSGRGTLYYKGWPCPILGRVSMDLTIVALGTAPAEAGETLEVLGLNQDADTLAAAAGTIGYEILTGLGPRYRRTYR